MTREQKMERRKTMGKTYVYKPNPYDKSSREFRVEAEKRSRKNKSHRSPVVQITSIMSKLDNEVTDKQKSDKKNKRKEN